MIERGEEMSRDTSGFLLDKKTHSVRAATILGYSGPGALVDFPSQLLMTAAPSRWLDGDGKVSLHKIYEPRLQKALKVDYFGLPLYDSDVERTLPMVRFPRWYSCPECNRLRPLDKWIAEFKFLNPETNKKNKDMMKKLFCPKCKSKINLVPAPLVQVCSQGHIDDFPWIKWVHAEGKRIEECDNPELKLIITGDSSGLDSVAIQCTTCKRKRILSGVLQPQKIISVLGHSAGKCAGKHPWRSNRSNRCDAMPRAVMRSASMLYYPYVESALSLPSGSDILVKKIKEHEDFAGYMEDFEKDLRKYNEADESKKERFLKRMLEDIDDAIQDMKKAFPEESTTRIENKVKELMKISIDDDKKTDPELDKTVFREEEYLALTNPETITQFDDINEDFYCEVLDKSEFNTMPFIKKVTLVHKLREVRVLTGFSRIEPVFSSKDEKFVSVKDDKDKWYPGYEIRGEGIFMEFDDDLIKQWHENHPEVEERAKSLSEKYRATYHAKNNPRIISAKFLLLHSIAHLLIKQLSLECGYGIAALRERIYCDEKGKGSMPMSGILIYTANGDIKGTMGGLVRQGYGDLWPYIFTNAIESAEYCSNDPICTFSSGQGRDGLNLAACHSCLLLPETCCEEFNIFLDRGVVIGTFDNPDMGFFKNV